MWYLLMMILIYTDRFFCWQELSKCTKPIKTSEKQDSSVEINQLNLDCNSDFIFISWAHYGYKQLNDTCSFSPKDCIVNVEYVSNECNGLSACNLSLDSQYLHSCKAFSNYLFIVYDCIKRGSTFNLCDEIDSKIEINKNGDSVFYLQSPNYPNEYPNNLDCNCTLKSSNYKQHLQIQILEFDLESSSNSINQFVSSHSFQSFVSFHSNKLSKNTSCQKDSFIVDSDTPICGILDPFTIFLNENKAISKFTNFRFKTDDVLNRRGFWIRINIKTYKFKCPDNFISINNLCIKIYNELLTWYEANTYCANLGHSLALIDNFEMDNQLNKALFDPEESIQFSLVSDSHGINNSLNNVKNFWVGMRQLNKTNWFDFKNQAISFRKDEENWWPWLAIDSSTYNQGSCVAKKKGSFYLQDCYKRMRFACQFNQKKKDFKSNDITNNLQCGKQNKHLTNEVFKTNSVVLSIEIQKSFQKINSINQNTSISIPSKQIEHSKIMIFEEIDFHSNESFTKFETKNSGYFMNEGMTSNSNVLYSIAIIGFIFIIILINSFVIHYFQRKRKLLVIKNEQNQCLANEKKLSSSFNHETINSKTINTSFSNTYSSPLSYDCLSNLNLTNHSQTNESPSVYNILSNFNNSQRQNLFIKRNILAPNVYISESPSEKVVLNSNQSTSSDFLKNLKQNNFKHCQNNNELFSHLYETISVSNVGNSLCNHNVMYCKLYNNTNDNLFSNRNILAECQSTIKNNELKEQKILNVKKQNNIIKMLNEQLNEKHKNERIFFKTNEAIV